jgi:hypothetical protein
MVTKPKEGNERLNKYMNKCVYFHKYLYYDVNFTATNFESLDKIRVSICIKYENVYIPKNSIVWIVSTVEQIGEKLNNFLSLNKIQPLRLRPENELKLYYRGYLQKAS